MFGRKLYVHSTSFFSNQGQIHQVEKKSVGQNMNMCIFTPPIDVLYSDGPALKPEPKNCLLRFHGKAVYRPPRNLEPPDH